MIFFILKEYFIKFFSLIQAEPTRHDSISNQAKFLKRSSGTLRDAAERHKTDVIGENIKIFFLFVFFKLVNLNCL